jgi:hypothetical protein
MPKSTFIEIPPEEQVHMLAALLRAVWLPAGPSYAVIMMRGGLADHV